MQDIKQIRHTKFNALPLFLSKTKATPQRIVTEMPTQIICLISIEEEFTG